MSSRSAKKSSRKSRSVSEKPVDIVSPVQLQRRAEKVVDLVMAHSDAFPFNEPVDPVALQIPTYFDVIKNPMDLGTVRTKLSDNQYRYIQDFIADVKLIWSNCYTFNDVKSEISFMAKNLSKYFDKLVNENLANCKIDISTIEGEEGLLIKEEKIEFAPATKSSKQVPTDDELKQNDFICSVCEKPGQLLFCDGPCLRSFHLSCTSLPAFPPDNEDQPWFCEDCESGVHECFVCKEIGMDEIELVKCSHPACGRFYHQNCIFSNPLTTKKKFAGPVQSQKFTCPLHMCEACGKPGSLEELSRCFRCPSAFHHHCMPVESTNPSHQGGPYAYRIITEYIICAKHGVKEKRNIPSLHEMNLPRKPFIKPFDSVDNAAKPVQTFSAEEIASIMEDDPLKTKASLWTGLIPIRKIMGSPITSDLVSEALSSRNIPLDLAKCLKS